MKRCHIAIPSDKFEKLLALQGIFFEKTNLSLSWGEFFVQAAAYFVGDISANRVDAVRLSRYVYGAYCPECEELNALLGKVIVWYITCEKCGHDFVASNR